MYIPYPWHRCGPWLREVAKLKEPGPEDENIAHCASLLSCLGAKNQMSLLRCSIGATSGTS